MELTVAILHMHSFQESDGRQVPYVGDTDNSRDGGVLEQKIDCFANRFSCQAEPLRLSTQREANLCFFFS